MMIPLRLKKENGGLYKGKYIDNFQSFRRLECIIEETKIRLNSNDEIPLAVYNPYPEAIDLQEFEVCRHLFRPS